MRNLRRRIPNLTALTFFECAGRHLSFSRTAKELHVTQGAVSRQIKLLEESLGFALFTRLHRAVRLTPAGRQLHQTVTVALTQISAVIDEITGSPDPKHITLAATHAVTNCWLMPRIPRLRARFPDLDIQVLATDTELTEIKDHFDIGVRYGGGRWPGFLSESLGTCDIFPVCSPAYECSEQLQTPSDLLRESLLQLDDDRREWIDWPAWFKALGVSGPYPRPALRANSYTVLLQAAMDGQGVALGWGHLVHEAVKSGALVIPLDACVRTRDQFYLTLVRSRDLSKDAESMIAWLKNEFRRA